jgi:carbonic anhydrase/acetyltransferase-like protein (isoleucine patch superfamily)
VATGVIVFQGALVGDGTRLGAGSIVHIGTVLPGESRVGLRHVAVATEEGALVTWDLDEARKAIAEADFFGTVFDEREYEQSRLHDEVMERLLREIRGWRDEPLT